MALETECLLAKHEDPARTPALASWGAVHLWAEMGRGLAVTLSLNPSVGGARGIAAIGCPLSSLSAHSPSSP